MTKISKSDRQEAIARLREWIKPGDTLYTQIKNVSRSGMSRVIQLVGISCGGDGPSLSYYGWNAHKAGVGSGYDEKREGVKMGGCGMDMGFALVYELSHVLYPTYECLGDKCPSSEHQHRTERHECKKCKGSGFLDAGRPVDSPIPDSAEKCPKCRGHGSALTYHEQPRGAGVVHKDGYALKQRWL